MNKLKVATIVGTRPELIKLSETIKLADRCFDHTLIHTGQNYDHALNEIFFEELKLPQPDFYLNAPGAHLGETIGNIVSKSYELLQKLMPDAVLILGDTNSALSAISAKRLKIPIFHMEAGNRCFDENLPEEVNRRMIDHISDVNLAYTEHARRYLLAENLRPEYVFVTGSPMPEVLRVNIGQHVQLSDALKKLQPDAPKRSQSDVLNRLRLEAGRFFLLSAHREENIDIEENFLSLMEAVNTLAEKYEFPIIYSMHPRSGKFIEQRKFNMHPLVQKMAPFGFNDYIALQKSAFCVISDSGTLAEESSILRFPAVSLRTSTERPEAVDKGSFVVGGIKKESVLRAVDLAITLKDITLPDIPDYVDYNVSAKVVKIIQGYTGIINERIWRKNI